MGEVGDHLPFREAISALHHASSPTCLPTKGPHRLFHWLKGHEQQLLTEALSQQTSIKSAPRFLRNEVSKISKPMSKTMTRSTGRGKNISIGSIRRAAMPGSCSILSYRAPGQDFFECFSRDELACGRLSCDHDTFKRIGDISYGTTNIDYSHALYDESQKIRSYRTTSLAIDPKGFDVQTTGEEVYREEKIDLPDSWVRGFLQVSSAMALPAHVVELHPMDMHES